MPVVSSSRLIRLGGISAMAGGALSLVLALPLAPEAPLIRIPAQLPLFGGALNLAEVLGSALIAAGTLGLYAAVVRRSPRLATLGVVLTSLSAVVSAGTGLYQALFVLFSGYPEGAVTPLWTTSVSGTAGLVGSLLLGVAVLRARALGRWSALPLALWTIPPASPLLSPLVVYGPAGGVVGAATLIRALITLPAVLGDLGWVLLGYLLWSGRTGNPASPTRVA